MCITDDFKVRVACNGCEKYESCNKRLDINDIETNDESIDISQIELLKDFE